MASALGGTSDGLDTDLARPALPGRDVVGDSDVLAGPQLGRPAHDLIPQVAKDEAAEVPELRDDTGLQGPMSGVLAEGIVAPADIAAAIRAYDWPYEWAERTAWCESRYDPSVTGRAGERGLMQIAYVHIDRIQRLGFTWAQMYEAGPNLAVAYNLWLEQGETPWEGTSDCRGD